jgi:hypothetical protein
VGEEEPKGIQELANKMRQEIGGPYLGKVSRNALFGVCTNASAGFDCFDCVHDCLFLNHRRTWWGQAARQRGVLAVTSSGFIGD